MIKRLFIVCFCMISVLPLLAQKYGNEWINFSQRYYRINIPKTGLYRIDSITLANSGIPLSFINPKNLQLFIKGEEQYIRINGESDNVFNATDYLEFYAEKNDGRFDSLAYTNITRLPNPYIPLFNDTNYAFITWNSAINNKRVTLESDVNFSGYTASNYIYGEKVTAYSNDYSQGNVVVTGVSDPRYIVAEGYGSTISQNISLSLSSNYNTYQSPSLPVYIRASYSGSSQTYISAGYDHQIKLEYYNNTGGYTVINDTTFLGYTQLLVDKQTTSDLLNNNTTIRITSVNNPLFSGFTSRTMVHYLYFKYPQTTNFLGASEQTFFVDNSTSNSKTFLDLQNVSAGSSSVIFYDLTNHKYISTTLVAGNNVKALVPNSASQKKCFLTTSANITNVTSLARVNQTGFFENYKTNNPDSAYLIVSHSKLQSTANDYKVYRESPIGGANHVILADVDNLYDQFAYGNKKNPLAIKNFCRYLSDSLPTPPKYLLLLGKSIKHDFIRNGGANWNNCDVPTMGIPSSDNLLTAGMRGANSVTPFIPLGRVSAKTNAEATNYLNKVKVHESTLPNHDDWRKHVIHFAGGTDASQQQLFQSYLQSYATTISDTLFGGQVYNFQKTTTAPIQITISDSVKQLIDYGASIITFFGHGSATGFDQAIDDPNAYNNKNKYPFFIANSCYSGDIHNPSSNSTSENFTLINEKGSIGFLASSSLGIVSPLNYYSSALYKSLAVETYYKGIGDAVKNTCIKNSSFGDQLLDMTCLDMTLEGDPYIRINAYTKPDYEIKNSSIVLDAQTYIDSIGVAIHIKNIGKAIVDTFIVRVERYFPTGDSATFLRKTKAPYNQGVLAFNILKDFDKGVGLNHFKVVVDAYNEIGELLETNNSTTGTVDLFISGGDVVPVYPYKYAIIPNTPQVTLKASTADPFALNANYRIQLDTNDQFTAPINQTLVNSIGGVVEWSVSLPFADSTVYFWRITRDSVATTDRLKWRESSFQVIGNKTGWEQAHFHQFKADDYEFVKFNRASRRFDFANDVKSLECNDGFLPTVAFDQINYKLNNSLEDYWSCSPDGWSFAIFDSISAKAWQQSSPTAPILGPMGNCICVSNQVLRSYSFGASSYCAPSPWQNNMESFLNSIPANSKILAWTIQNHHSQSFSNSLYNAFESFGAANIRTVKDTVPYIIFGTKGAGIGSAHELFGFNTSSVLQLKDTLKTKWNSGYIASEIIGPGAKWNSLHWKQVPRELPNTDSIVLKVIGIKLNGVRDTLVTFPKDSLDVYDLANYADASVYPYLQLVALMKDNVSLTPPQLKKWQVIYDHVAECAINPKKGFAMTNDTIQEGEKLVIRLPIENIGVLPFTDSLLVTYWLEDRDRVIHPLPQKLKLKPFVPSQVIIDTINVSTFQYVGQNYAWVDVNPPTNAKYQLEQYHFNNIVRIPFFVSTDKINPLLDVTFDGTHILNGDVISAKPHVLVTLKDENKFLALNDTSNFAVFIKYPNQSTEKRLYFGNTLQFTPAQLPSNSCKIEWKPELAIDGKYTLIVQATDRSKNVSGSVDYNIQFEVITKQTVTEVLNYPNPFSTSTRFVFTLTGSEVPDVFTIQIMTITGKVVKEITKNELGNIRIGRNITEYAWDGKDTYGDKLGNGVYLYRVITRHNNEAVEKNQTEADSFFKKGIGKMVIMR